jgi:hypothetical protein
MNNKSGSYKRIGTPLPIGTQSIPQRDADNQPGEGVRLIEPRPEVNPKRVGSGKGARHTENAGIPLEKVNPSWAGQEGQTHSDVNRTLNPTAEFGEAPSRFTTPENESPSWQPGKDWKGKGEDWTGYEKSDDINRIIAREIARSTNDDE